MVWPAWTSCCSANYNVNETNAPSGYKIDDTTTHKVTVDNAATCGSGNEETISFSDTPLSKVTVSFESLARGIRPRPRSSGPARVRPALSRKARQRSWTTWRPARTAARWWLIRRRSRHAVLSGEGAGSRGPAPFPFSDERSIRLREAGGVDLHVPAFGAGELIRVGSRVLGRFVQREGTIWRASQRTPHRPGRVRDPQVDGRIGGQTPRRHHVCLA